jgi:type IV pilus modification protein PilV
VTSERPARADAGFTLIEVLIAMVILAIGLLAVEALGIGAARTVQRARVQSAYTALATDEMEQVMATIDNDPDSEIDDLEYEVPAGNGAASGAQVTRTATFAAIANTRPTGRTSLNLWTVVVSVRPPAGSSLIAPSDSVHLESNVIR